jgi:hypothetical protein
MSFMQLYTQRRRSFRVLPISNTEKVTVQLPSYLFRVADETFSNLGDSHHIRHVTGRALPEYTSSTSNPPALVMAQTQELIMSASNPDRGIKRSPLIVCQNEMIIENILEALCALCPSLQPQFDRLGRNRLRALEMTRDYKCWNCDQRGVSGTTPALQSLRHRCSRVMRSRHLRHRVARLSRCELYTFLGSAAGRPSPSNQTNSFRPDAFLR